MNDRHSGSASESKCACFHDYFNSMLNIISKDMIIDNKSDAYCSCVFRFNRAIEGRSSSGKKMVIL